MRSRQGRLLRKYAIVFGALVGGSLIAGTLVQLYFSYQESQSAILRIAPAEAARAALRITQFVDSMQEQVTAILPPPGLAELPCEERQATFLALQRRAPEIADVIFIDRDGREQVKVSRLALNETCKGTDRSDDPSFVQTRTGTAYYSPVEFRRGSEPFFRIAVPEGKDAGVTVATVNLRFILDPVTSIKVGNLGDVYVVDSVGLLIAHADISRVLKLTDLSALPQVQAARLSPGSTRESAMIARNSDGQSVVTAFEVIPTTSWAVFVEQPLDEAFAPSTASLWRAGGILALGLAVSLLASLVLSSRMVEPIEAIRVGAARIGKGGLDQRIAVHTGDELEDLADEFNQMTTRLRESYATLEQTVADRTHDLGQALEQQTAIAEVLNKSSSGFEIGPVLDSVVTNAARLAYADAAWLSQLEGGLFTLLDRPSLGAYGRTPEILAELLALREGPGFGRPSAATVIGRAALEMMEIHVPDIRATPEFAKSATALGIGARTVLAMPMLAKGEPVGVFVLARLEVRPFLEGEIGLVRTFADQAAIAIENVRLFRQIGEKSRLIEAASKNKSEFLANMSHELRTPLHAIIGFAELLLGRTSGELTTGQDRYVRDILASGKHQLAVINDVLDLSKVEAGYLELERSTFSVSQSVADALTFVRARATQRRIRLAEQIAPGVGEIDGDQRKVKQVLVNLLSNAVKFTPDGGCVAVRASRENNEVIIAVSDTGTGVTSDDKGRIFLEFGQTTSARGHEGTGLGLALAKRLIELHGGRIWVESEPGEGSTFIFTIPASDAERQALRS